MITHEERAKRLMAGRLDSTNPIIQRFVHSRLHGIEEVIAAAFNEVEREALQQKVRKDAEAMSLM